MSPTTRVKCLGYLDNILAAREAAEKGADEALLLNGAGNLASASAANLFAVIDGELVTGKLGADVGLERGQQAARACGLMILAQLEAHDLLERVERVVKLGGFVASVPDFTDQPKVVNGASDLMAEVFGDKGKHARSAVGVPVLPLNAAVEVDAVLALSGA